MKRLSLLALLALLFASCGDDDEVPTQDLSGMIDGISFNATTAVYEEEGNDRLSFKIISENVPPSFEACNLIPGDLNIFFEADNTTDRQELYLDLINFEGFTITLSNPSEEQTYIVSSGYFKINSIDDNSLTAEMDISFDNENFISGSFEANLCE